MELKQYATVFSGRRGVAFDVAPEPLSDLITRVAGPGVDTDTKYSSAASNVNFLVMVSVAENGREKTVGTIHVMNGKAGRILE